MKYIKMTELVKGDIFCEEMKLKGRKAFLVVDIVAETIISQDRDTSSIVEKKMKGSVALLKHIDI
jgi:hypothetical protein